MTTSPTKLQPPQLPLAPTPTQPTPIRSTASAAAHLTHEHNAPSDATHLATDRTGPQHRKCLNHFAQKSSVRIAAKRLVLTSSHQPTPTKSTAHAVGHFANHTTTTTAATRVNHYAPTYAS